MKGEIEFSALVTTVHGHTYMPRVIAERDADDIRLVSIKSDGLEIGGLLSDSTQDKLMALAIKHFDRKEP